MDLNKLRDFFTSQTYTDIELVFSNGTQQVTVQAHKLVLASGCDYFHKMFNFNRDITTTKIIVDEPNVAYDVIASFYGINSNSKNYPEWRHVLEIFKTRQFFCLYNDVSVLYDLDVPSDGFDLFLEVASQFDIVTDHKLLRSIRRNLPEKYDLTKLSDSFVELLQKKTYRIVSGSSDKTIKIWDGDNGSLIHTINGHIKSVSSVAVSPDGLRVVSGSYDTTIKIWDADDGSLLHTLKGHTDWVEYVAFSPNSQQIVSGSSDQTIKIWDAINGSLIHTLTGHTGSVLNLTFSPDGLRIVSGSDDNTIKIWNIVDSSFITYLNRPY